MEEGTALSGNINVVRTARNSVVNNSGLISNTFLQSSLSLLKKHIAIRENELSEIKKELVLMDKGVLHIHRRGDRFEFGYRETDSGKVRGITGDIERIHSLARLAVIEERKSLLELQLKRIESIVDRLDEARYEQRLAKKLRRYNEAGLDLSRILFTKEQNEWIDEPYNPNPYHRENLIYSTTNNMYMRSNSETKIGSRFELAGLPYRYDDFVEIGSDARAKAYRSEAGPFHESYFADFKVPNLLGGITVHEHLGAFHVGNYGDSSLKRLNDYHNFGVMEIPGRRVKHSEFTWSFENDVRNEVMLDQLLARMLLPGLL